MATTITAKQEMKMTFNAFPLESLASRGNQNAAKRQEAVWQYDHALIVHAAIPQH